MIVFSTPPDQHQAVGKEETELDHWKLVYDEVRRAYSARVEEVATQQSRLAVVLAANGLVFAFIGSALAAFDTLPGHSALSAGLFIAGLTLLAGGLLAGGVGLWPRIAIKSGTGGRLAADMTPEEGFFLDVGDVWAHGTTQSTAGFLHWLANQVQDDAARSKHVRVLRFRRWMIKAQIACIVAGAFLIVAAVIASLPT